MSAFTDKTFVHIDDAGIVVHAEIPVSMKDIEREIILQFLKEKHGSRTETAKAVGMKRPLLIYKLRKYRDAGFDVTPAHGRWCRNCKTWGVE